MHRRNMLFNIVGYIGGALAIPFLGTKPLKNFHANAKQYDTEEPTYDEVRNGYMISGGMPGDQRITLTGDVIGSGSGSFATTIGCIKITKEQISA